MINAYLQSKTEMDDGAIHLLFSANRWEKRREEEKLSSGVTLVVDRYSYSGVAFTAAKGVPGLDLEWCKAPERGLLRPDAVLYLNMPIEAAQKRGGFGEERYETSDLQKARANFEQLTEDWWTIVDATERWRRLRRSANESPKTRWTDARRGWSSPGCGSRRCGSGTVRATHGRESESRATFSRAMRGSVLARGAARFMKISRLLARPRIAAPAPTSNASLSRGHTLARARVLEAFRMSERRSVEPREGVAYPVSLGASLSRVGDGDGDDAYVALRYDARVPGIDPTKPGRVRLDENGKRVRVEFQNVVDGERAINYQGVYAENKDDPREAGVECALIFDPDSGVVHDRAPRGHREGPSRDARRGGRRRGGGGWASTRTPPRARRQPPRRGNDPPRTHARRRP